MQIPGKAGGNSDPRARRSATGNGHARACRAGCSDATTFYWRVLPPRGEGGDKAAVAVTGGRSPSDFLRDKFETFRIAFSVASRVVARMFHWRQRSFAVRSFDAADPWPSQRRRGAKHRTEPQHAGATHP